QAAEEGGGVGRTHEPVAIEEAEAAFGQAVQEILVLVRVVQGRLRVAHAEEDGAEQERGQRLNGALGRGVGGHGVRSAGRVNGGSVCRSPGRRGAGRWW